MPLAFSAHLREVLPIGFGVRASIAHCFGACPAPGQPWFFSFHQGWSVRGTKPVAGFRRAVETSTFVDCWPSLPKVTQLLPLGHFSAVNDRDRLAGKFFKAFEVEDLVPHPGSRKLRYPSGLRSDRTCIGTGLCVRAWLAALSPGVIGPPHTEQLITSFLIPAIRCTYHAEGSPNRVCV